MIFNDLIIEIIVLSYILGTLQYFQKIFKILNLYLKKIRDFNFVRNFLNVIIT